jgi:ATP-dependent helicase/nuclease subunit B
MGGDPFLPNRARRELGIRDSNSRLVRDSYLLTAILESRKTSGRVDLVLGRTNEDGDPMRPSRLLFRCSDDELPARALRLCKGEELEIAPSPAWKAAWQLQPPPLPEESTIGERISVTGFRGYLACPFRYYLKFGLGMEELDITKVEMDARDFGNLCHYALEDFGEDGALRDSTDESAIRGFLIDRLETRTYARYGRHLSVPLAFQLESAKQRLAWAAAIQVRERAAGWRIEETEWKIHENSDWKIGGLAIRGTIDRIERNERDGHWRVLDYKTSAQAKSPPSAHLARLKPETSPDEYPQWSLLELGGNTQRWTDLQVPLYVLALRELRGADRVAAGYFNLARSVSETQIETWDTLDDPILRSAHTCAEGIAGAIRENIFWPPNPAPEFDDFAPILFGDAASLALPPIR